MQVQSLFISNFCCRLGRGNGGDRRRNWEEELGQEREWGTYLQTFVETAEERIQHAQKLNLIHLRQVLHNQTELYSSMCSPEYLINQSKDRHCLSTVFFQSPSTQLYTICL